MCKGHSLHVVLYLSESSLWGASSRANTETGAPAYHVQYEFLPRTIKTSFDGRWGGWLTRTWACATKHHTSFSFSLNTQLMQPQIHVQMCDFTDSAHPPDLLFYSAPSNPLWRGCSVVRGGCPIRAKLKVWIRLCALQPCIQAAPLPFALPQL